MSTTQEKLEGKMTSVEYVGDSKGGWKRYNVVFEDGQECRVIVPPDVNEELKVGETKNFYKGAYNSWVLDQQNVTGGGATGHMGREDYWRAKDTRDAEYQDYTKAEVNPKIEFQSYFERVSEIYAAALPNLTKPPKTTAELDAYIDDAYAKTEAIFARRQKAFAKKNA